MAGAFSSAFSSAFDIDVSSGGSCAFSRAFSSAFDMCPVGPVVPPPTETPSLPSTGGGGGRHYPIGAGGYKERRRIADEMRALYRDVYDEAKTSDPIGEEAAALVAKYAPVSAPDLPPPNQIDWDMLAEQSRATIAAFRAAIAHIQEMIAAQQAERDDEEVLLLLAD